MSDERLDSLLNDLVKLGADIENAESDDESIRAEREIAGVKGQIHAMFDEIENTLDGWRDAASHPDD